MLHAKYWSCAKGQDLWRYEIAGDTAPEDVSTHARDLLAAGEGEDEWIEFFDPAQMRYRSALLRTGRLEGCLFIGAGQPDAGCIVCACYSAGVNTLCEAIRTQGLDTPEAIGRRLKAGTNCSSCVPELRMLIQMVLGKDAA